MGPHKEETVVPEVAAEAAAEAPAGGSEKKGEFTSDAYTSSENEKRKAEKLSALIPKTCYTGLTIPINWMVRPEMLFWTVMYNTDLNLCSWLLPACDYFWALTPGFVALTLIGKAGPIGMIFNWGKKALLGLFAFEIVCCTLANWYMETTIPGLAGSLLLEMVAVAILGRMGKLDARRSSYFCWMMLYFIVGQIGPSLIFRFPQVLEMLPTILEAFALPIISTIVSGVGSWALRRINRAKLTTGMPVRPLTSVLYMVLFMSQLLIILGCIPKADMLESRDVTTLLLRYGGAFFSSTNSEIITRCFVLQRAKNIIETKLGFNPEPLKIEPEMDTQIRAYFALGPLSVFYGAFFLLTCIYVPAEWPRDPLVWLGLAVKLTSGIICDLVVMVANRRLHPVKGETMVQTWTRLQEPFQHWPERQCDKGEQFQAAKAKVEGTGGAGRTSKLDTATEAMANAVYSKHWYFTDFRLVLLLIVTVPINFLGTGFGAIFGYCGFWYHLDHHYCQVN